VAFSEDFKNQLEDLYGEFGEAATLQYVGGTKALRTVILEPIPERHEQNSNGTATTREQRLHVRTSEGPVPQRNDRWIIDGETWAIERFEPNQARHGTVAMRIVRQERREMAHDGYRQRTIA
jgi:hypothetical protein